MTATLTTPAPAPAPAADDDAEPTQAAEHPATSAIGRAAGTALFVLLVVVLVAAVAAFVAVPRVLGASTYTILTGSMAPALPPGTVVVSAPRPVEDIRIGDVVTYQVHSGRPPVITHRVVGLATDTRGERAFIMRGDNNTLNDPAPIIHEQVRGVVVYSVPYAGLVLHSVTGEARTWAPIAIGVAFIAWGTGYVLAHLVDRRRARHADPAVRSTP